MDYLTIGFGLVGGTGWSLLRFYREKQKNKNVEFSIKNLLKTVIIGALVGAVASVSGLEFDAITSTAVYGSLTGVADSAVNVIWGIFHK